MATNLQAQWLDYTITEQQISDLQKEVKNLEQLQNHCQVRFSRLAQLKAQLRALKIQQYQLKKEMVERTFVCTPRQGEKLAELKTLDQVDLDFANWNDIISGKVLYHNGEFYTVKDGEMVCGSGITEGGSNTLLQKVVDWKTGYTDYRYNQVGELTHKEKNRTYWYANHCRKLCWYSLGGWKNQKGVNWSSKSQQYWIDLAISNGLTPQPKVKHIVVNNLKPEITESEAEAMEKAYLEDRLGRYGY